MEIKPVVLPVRYFIEDEYKGDDGTVTECSEAEFVDHWSEQITYERHTVHANGVDQICLTKWLYY
jgi:hypothetical protein